MDGSLILFIAKKLVLNMPGIITTRLLYTDYYLTIMRAETQDGKGSEKTVLANYTTSNKILKNERVLVTVIGNMRVS